MASQPREIEGAEGESIETARIVFEGRTDHTAGDLLGAPLDGDERSARDEAVQFLDAKLAEGPIRSKELIGSAKDAGISETTLRRAKKELGIKVDQKTDGWYWSLPEEAQS